ncbi:MAG: 50S ribosomal protein L37ae [Candidatus Nanoarchaeia archaeon]
MKRYGVRYGRTTKNKVGKIEAGYRKKNKCPYCNYLAIKRLAAGIWTCKKCGVKFAAKAYSPEFRAEA